MCDVSIILPTIRTHLLEDLYDSVVKSCPEHSFELITVGPFDIPESLLCKGNVTYIKDYGQPTRALQIACTKAKGDLIHPLVDDCFYYPNRLSETINIFRKKCCDADILGMRFFENPEHYTKIKSGLTIEEHPSQRNVSHPDSYWYAGASYGYLSGVSPHWGIACLFLTKTDVIHKYGGWDCQFEYNNHSTHDLLFRLQQNGSKFYLTDHDIFVANWYQGITVDHAPVHYGQLTHDLPLFQQIWGTNNNRCVIDINNWENSSDLWERRFGDKKPTTYEDMLNGL